MVSTRLDTVTITSQYLLMDGTALRGTVTFSPSVSYLVDATQNQTLFAKPYVATLNGTTGIFSIAIPVNTDPDLAPVNWTWQVQENLSLPSGASVPGRTFSISIPVERVGQTVKLNEFAPAVPSQGTVSFVLQSQVGAVGGPAGPLTSGGKVPTSQVPAIAHTHVDADLPAGIARDTEVDAAIATRAPLSHAHVDADLPVGIARDAEVAAAVDVHLTTVPHLTTENLDDRIANLLVAGTNITLTYDDVANTLTIASTATGGLTQEQAEDIVGALIQDNSVMDFTYDDAAGSLVATIKPGVVTSTMLAGSIPLSKLATDPLSRTNHTGTQVASTISDFSEAVDDRIANTLIAGTNVTLTYNDAANTLTIAAAGGTVANGSITEPKLADDSVSPRTLTDLTIATIDGRAQTVVDAQIEFYDSTIPRNEAATSPSLRNLTQFGQVPNALYAAPGDLGLSGSPAGTFPILSAFGTLLAYTPGSPGQVLTATGTGNGLGWTTVSSSGAVSLDDFITVAHANSSQLMKDRATASGGAILGTTDPVANSNTIETAMAAGSSKAGLFFARGSSLVGMIAHPQGGTRFGAIFPRSTMVIRGEDSRETTLQLALGSVNWDWANTTANTIPGGYAGMVYPRDGITDLHMYGITFDGRANTVISGQSHTRARQWGGIRFGTGSNTKVVVEDVVFKNHRGTSGGGGGDETSYVDLTNLSHYTFRDVTLQSVDSNSTASGFHCNSNADFGLVENVRVFGGGRIFHAFPLWKSDNVRRVNCYAEACTSSGYRDEFGFNVTDEGNYATGCGSGGGTGAYHVGGGRYHRWVNCVAENNGGAGWLLAGTKQDTNGTWVVSTSWRVIGCSSMSNTRPDIDILNEALGGQALPGGFFGWGTVLASASQFTTSTAGKVRADYERFNS